MRKHVFMSELTNPMLRKRFLVEGFGSVKKFHILTQDRSDKEERDNLEEEEEVLLDEVDNGTVCPEVEIY